jgi:hypothetical protein
MAGCLNEIYARVWTFPESIISLIKDSWKVKSSASFIRGLRKVSSLERQVSGHDLSRTKQRDGLRSRAKSAKQKSFIAAAGWSERERSDMREAILSLLLFRLGCSEDAHSSKSPTKSIYLVALGLRLCASLRQCGRSIFLRSTARLKLDALTLLHVR